MMMLNWQLLIRVIYLRIKDPDYFALLESIISRMDIDLNKDIKIANPVLVMKK